MIRKPASSMKTLTLPVEDAGFRQKVEKFICDESSRGNRVYVDLFRSNNDVVYYVLFTRGQDDVEQGKFVREA